MKVIDLASRNNDKNCKCNCRCTEKNLLHDYCDECAQFNNYSHRYDSFISDDEVKRHFEDGKKVIRKGERKGFSNSIKQSTILKQKSLCAICNKFSPLWEYDHKDNDRSNNNQSNCQALCPNCHANKTRGLN